MGVFVVAACGDDGGMKRPSDAPGAGIYVATTTNQIVVFELGATGAAAPIRTIAGPTTGLNLPIGFDIDATGDLYVANRQGGTITVYDKDATGDVAPKRTLTATGMGAPEGLAVGAGNEVFVSTCPSCGTGGGGNSGIFHFAAGATTSDRAIGNAANTLTGLTAPVSLAYDASAASLVTGNAFGGTIETFPADASGDLAPVRTFQPSASNLQWLVVADSTIFVVDPTAGLVQYPAAATGTADGFAQAFTAPLTVQYPGGVWVDAALEQPDLYIVDYTAGSVYVAHTSGRAPNLKVETVDVLSGPATAGALEVRVVR